MKQTAIRLNGRRIGYINDDNPHWLFIHKYMRHRALEHIGGQVRELMGNPHLQIRRLPPPPARSRATSGDLF